jgi:S1-C subfamily serine protease
MPTFNDLRNEYDRLRLSKAVYLDLADYLKRCLPSDAGDPELAIPAPDGFTGNVSEEVISSVHAEMLKRVQDCDEQISTMDLVSIQGGSGGAAQEQGQKPGAKSKPTGGK